MSMATRRGGTGLIDLTCEIRHETDQAVAVADGTIDMDLGDGKEKWFWLPKSLVEVNGDGTITLPEWLAQEKGLI